MVLFMALHRLSWLTFVGLFLWAGVVGLPAHGALILSGLLWYILGYWLLCGLRGIYRVCCPSPIVTPPEEPQVLRRIILEEYTPYVADTRSVLKDVTPTHGRNAHVR